MTPPKTINEEISCFLEKPKILKIGDPRLLRKAELVSKEDIGWLSPVLTEMVRLMNTNGGVGLASQQVGINLMFFIAMRPPGTLEVVINPCINKNVGDKMEYMGEGCLSIPNLTVNVLRPTSIDVSYQTTTLIKCNNNTYKINPNKVKVVHEVLTGIYARIFQHETDHGNGILIVDKNRSSTKDIEYIDSSSLEE